MYFSFHKTSEPRFPIVVMFFLFLTFLFHSTPSSQKSGNMLLLTFSPYLQKVVPLQEVRLFLDILPEYSFPSVS